MSNLVQVELNVIPCAASRKGVWALQHARKMGYDDETTANLVYGEMLLVAAHGVRHTTPAGGNVFEDLGLPDAEALQVAAIEQATGAQP